MYTKKTSMAQLYKLSPTNLTLIMGRNPLKHSNSSCCCVQLSSNSWKHQKPAQDKGSEGYQSADMEIVEGTGGMPPEPYTQE